MLNEIRKKNPDVQVIFFPLDLADKKSIEFFVERIKEVCDSVNVLINNAGVLMLNRK